MAAHSNKDVAFLNFQNRRRGIVKALTDEFERTLQKCMSVMPGSTYTQRYVLVGLDDGSYAMRHPTANEMLEAPCLPPFHGQMTKNTWLLIALPSLHAWLISTLDPVFRAGTMSYEDRLSLIRSVESLSDLGDDVLSFHEKRSSNSMADKAPSEASVISSHCENNSCMRILETDWAECAVCGVWYHCRCVAIYPSDRYRRDSFICGEC